MKPPLRASNEKKKTGNQTRFKKKGPTIRLITEDDEEESGLYFETASSVERKYAPRIEPQQPYVKSRKIRKIEIQLSTMPKELNNSQSKDSKDRDQHIKFTQDFNLEGSDEISRLERTLSIKKQGTADSRLTDSNEKVKQFQVVP